MSQLETIEDPQALSRLVLQFESLGGNGDGGEFGLFQQELGAGPPGLLRWADLPHEDLVAALQFRFADIGSPNNTEVYVPDGGSGEYWVRDTRIALTMPTFVKATDVGPSAMLDPECARLQSLRDRIIADLAAGQKIFVYRDLFDNLTERQFERLHRAVRGYGASPLLYVRRADAAHASGTVELVAPGLMVGYMERFRRNAAQEVLGSVTAQWTSICRGALVLQGRDASATARAPEPEHVLRARAEDAAALTAAEQAPNNVSHWTTYARLAERRGEWAEAVLRWEAVRGRFPDHSAGYVGGANALARARRRVEGEALLAGVADRFSRLPEVAIALARFANMRAAWPDALQGWAGVRARFPGHNAGYLGGAQALIALRRFDEAETLLLEARQRWPEIPEPMAEYARVALVKRDLPEAMRRYDAAIASFPQYSPSYRGTAQTLVVAGDFDKADQALEAAALRFPDDQNIAFDYAGNAALRHDWTGELQRWRAAQRRFPSDSRIAEKLFAAQMRVAETGEPHHSAVVESAHEPSAELTDRDLMLRFESLGGLFWGCEFGLLQRQFGAEPLSLLRWTEINQTQLASALEDRFAGVGDPEHTEVKLVPTGTTHEYATVDKRYWMRMHTFVSVDQLSPEKIFVQSCRRLRYLAGKLVDDLADSDKIFVFKCSDKNLTTAELRRIHAAMQQYGRNVLLYVRYEDADHPNGSVRVVAPGLLVGAIDRFGYSRDRKQLPPATASWLPLLRNAYALRAAALS